MTDMPPPYPGINGYSAYNASYANASTAPPMGFNVQTQTQNGELQGASYAIRQRVLL